MRRNIIWAYPLAVLVVALDQWTKWLASMQLSFNTPVEILPVFNLTLHYNTGAAFSLLADAGGWQRLLFSAISMVVSLFLCSWIWRLNRHEKLMAASLALILGGALGNLWDRLLMGHVIDFISLHYASYYFPTFNVADSAITVGAGLMILDMIVNPENHRTHRKATSPSTTSSEKSNRGSQSESK